MRDKSEDLGSSLIDISGMSLADLDEISGSSLALALQQVLEDESVGTSAGFTSSV